MFLSQKGGALALLLPSLGLAGGCAQFAQFPARDLEENSSASRWLRDADLAAGELPQKRDYLGLPPTSSSLEKSLALGALFKSDFSGFEFKLPRMGWV